MSLDKQKTFSGDTDYTDNAVCPYCGDVNEDSWELCDYGDCECGECGKVYTIDRDVAVSYSTYKKEGGRKILGST